MKKIKNILLLSSLALAATMFQSCDVDSDDNSYLWQPTAIVTVTPMPDESCILQLDNETQLIPVNLKKSPFGDKEVRALVNYTPATDDASVKEVTVNWIDSIRTKMPLLDVTEEELVKLGNDPVEIVKDWVTVAEDGYITLRIRTFWGNPTKPHLINLIGDSNQSGDLQFELRHNAEGDTYGTMGDALIAFNLNDFITEPGKNVTVKLKWKSFEGEKSVDFTLGARNKTLEGNISRDIVTYHSLH